MEEALGAAFQRRVFWGMGAVLRTTALVEARFVQRGEKRAMIAQRGRADRE